ncbi:hypothetical protein ASPNIDRAFT_36751 [Aspergillus niger ATCC 1015]|uniref:Uncharacterized protein n=1 Tax=Aspergillus niger (strain ATCC 1015 / CBS 113.46 / FGSC A1144 / LSHB Ac4 / NCTC 3858a / NRRL 328 / USDA 3528.7) TaxID=380704 RepID=G3Y1Z7_ASPNA|nr:hypothetical protein ASPNIDRAFT_36751 [Aspergillus niger ATCC 1015]
MYKPYTSGTITLTSILRTRFHMIVNLVLRRIEPLFDLIQPVKVIHGNSPPSAAVLGLSLTSLSRTKKISSSLGPIISKVDEHVQLLAGLSEFQGLLLEKIKGAGGRGL